MKLGVIKIPNTQIDILSAQITNFNAFGTSAPYLATNDLDLDIYNDISTIQNWDRYGLSAQLANSYDVDYKVVRDEIGKLAFEKVQSNWNNWNNLTEEEQRIVAKYVACPKSYVAVVYPNNVSSVLKSWDEESTKARQYRYDILVRGALFLYLRQSKALSCLKTVSENGLLLAYFGGLEGSMEDGGVEGLFDYILSRPNTSFENNGLKERIEPTDIIYPGATSESIVNHIHSLLYYGY